MRSADVGATAVGGQSVKGEVQWTPLLWAARWGRPPCLRLLAEAAADLEYRDCLGRTALRHAAGQGTLRRGSRTGQSGGTESCGLAKLI